jgi:hypothetical protein
MTRNTMAPERLPAELARRVTCGDRKFMDRVRLGDIVKNREWPGDAFDDLDVQAKYLAYEMVRAGRIADVSKPGELGERLASIVKPCVGRLAHLAEGFEHHWLELGGGDVFPFAELVTYLKTLYRKELGAIHRDEIEQIDAAPADREINGCSDGIPDLAPADTRGVRGPESMRENVVGSSSKRNAKRGPKIKYPWEHCKAAVMKALEYDGEPSEDDENPKWRRQIDLENYIRDWMTGRSLSPGRSQVRAYTTKWLIEFRNKQQVGN